MKIPWKLIPGRERPEQPWIKDGSIFGRYACVCNKHRKIWFEGADFPKACKECCLKTT